MSVVDSYVRGVERPQDLYKPALKLMLSLCSREPSALGLVTSTVRDSMRATLFACSSAISSVEFGLGISSRCRAAESAEHAFTYSTIYAALIAKTVLDGTEQSKQLLEKSVAAGIGAMNDFMLLRQLFGNATEGVHGDTFDASESGPLGRLF